MTITITQMEHVLSLFPWPARLRRPRGILMHVHGTMAFECQVSSGIRGGKNRIHVGARAHTAERAFADAVEGYIEKGPAMVEPAFQLTPGERGALRRALRMLTN